MDVIEYVDPELETVFSDEGAEWYGELAAKPRIEQELFALQEAFYDPKKKRYKRDNWAKMLKLIRDYSQSLILKRVRGGGKYMEPEDLWDKSVQAALRFMNQYYNRPGFHTGASFAGMLNWKVMEVLHKGKQEDYHLSLSSIMGDEGSDLESQQEKVHFENVFGYEYQKPGDEEKTPLHTTISELFEDIDVGYEHDPRMSILTRLYLLIYIKRPKNKHCVAQFEKRYGNDYKVKKVLDLSLLELHDRLTR